MDGSKACSKCEISGQVLKELDAIKAQQGPDRQGEPSTAVRSAPSTENKLACSEDSDEQTLPESDSKLEDSESSQSVSNEVNNKSTCSVVAPVAEEQAEEQSCDTPPPQVAESSGRRRLLTEDLPAYV